MSDLFKKMYPMIEGIGSTIGIDKDQLRKRLIDSNNKKVMSKTFRYKPYEILVLLPHCIQYSGCNIRVTNDIYNCSRCGKCQIPDLIQLIDKYKVNIFIATGGTLARKAIMDMRPKGIIAVACERDLTSGLIDIKELSVIGILNDRPNGPCIDTSVNIQKVEEAIKFFLGGE